MDSYLVWFSSTNFRLKRVIHTTKLCTNTKIFCTEVFISQVIKGEKRYIYFEVEPNFVKLHCTNCVLALLYWPQCGR